MLQVIWKLLSKALKFTPTGGKIPSSLTRENTRSLISVSDTGKGIGPEFMRYVFEPFRQASDTGNHNGLGLAIVSRLVELHGGGIEAESEELGKGAPFNVWLPPSHMHMVKPFQLDSTKRLFIPLEWIQEKLAKFLIDKK